MNIFTDENKNISFRNLKSKEMDFLFAGTYGIVSVRYQHEIRKNTSKHKY